MLVSNETTQGNTTHYDIDDHVAVDLKNLNNKINLYEMNSSYYNSNNNNNEKDTLAQGKIIKDRLITNGFVKLENFLDKETVNNASIACMLSIKK